MTPAHIALLRDQIKVTQQGLADRLNTVDPLLRVNRQTVYRWEGGTPTQTPNPHSVAALTRLWLDVGYPAAIDGRPGVLTTNHSASSYGLPVAVIDGQAYGSGEVTRLDLGNAPPSIVEAVQRAGYVVG